MIDLRLLDVDENVSLQAETLRKAIEEDLKEGHIPIFVSTSSFRICC